MTQKDAYYFPHFSNARHDRKVRRVTKELGIEGYGIYFMILEVLRDEVDFRYPMEDIDLLADEFGTSDQKITVVVSNYQLFEVDANSMFYSPKLIDYMQPYLKMKEQRRLAGIASGEKRRKNSNNERPFNGCSTGAERNGNENEQSKVKESKVNNSSYYPIACRLRDVSLLRRKRTITEKTLQGWANTFRLMAERDGVNITSLWSSLDWYEKHWADDFVPVIESAKAMREKYDKLLNAVDRSSPKKEADEWI